MNVDPRMFRNTNQRKFLKFATKQGWKVIRSNKHIVLRHASGAVYTTSHSPTCPFAWEHAAKDMQRLLERK